MASTDTEEHTSPVSGDVKLSQQRNTENVNPPVDFSKFRLLHDVFRHRAEDPLQTPIIAFPQHEHHDFEYFTAMDMDGFTNSAAWLYEDRGLQTVSETRPSHANHMFREFLNFPLIILLL